MLFSYNNKKNKKTTEIGSSYDFFGGLLRDNGTLLYIFWISFFQHFLNKEPGKVLVAAGNHKRIKKYNINNNSDDFAGKTNLKIFNIRTHTHSYINIGTIRLLSATGRVQVRMAITRQSRYVKNNNMVYIEMEIELASHILGVCKG